MDDKKLEPQGDVKEPQKPPEGDKPPETPGPSKTEPEPSAKPETFTREQMNQYLLRLFHY